MLDLLKLILEIIVDFLTFKNKGFAQPDHEDQKDHPVITGAADASAQQLLDVYKKEVRRAAASSSLVGVGSGSWEE